MIRRPKLLFLTNDFGFGGVQRIVLDFSSHLTNGFDVSVAVLWDRPGTDIHQRQLDKNVSFHTIGFRKFWDFMGWYRLYRYIKKEQFDIVFTQVFMADFFGRTAAFLAGTPVIVTEIQNLIPNLPAKYLLIDRLLVSITDACISTTPAVTAYARSVIGFPEQKIFEVPTNAVDDRKFSLPVDRNAVRRSLGIPENAQLIISVGRLIEQKGHTVLLKALPHMLRTFPETYVAIAGEGILMQVLIEEAHALGIGERVRFLGARNDIPDLLKSANVFAFPSLYEGQGLVLFEAIFSHLPIVASNTGGIPDVIQDGETGLLVPPGNEKALAVAIENIMRNKDLAQRLTRTAFARFSDRTVLECAKRLRDTFHTLLRTKRTQVRAL